MSTSERKSHRLNHIPLYLKVIILVQAAVILVFTVGMYQEYLNNSYLQAYVVSIFSSNIMADLMLSMVTISVFAIGTFTLIGSVSSTRRVGREWKILSEPTEKEMEMPSMPVLETANQTSNRNKPTRRARPKRPRMSKEDLFRSMAKYADERKN